MLWKVWAAVGAIVCGVGVATFLGEGTPPEAKLILVAALVVGVVTTAVRRTTRGRHRPKGDSGPRRKREKIQDDHQDVALVEEGNREIIGRVHGLVRESEIDWLRTETFDASWRDDQVEPFRELALFDADRSGIADPALKAAVDRLTLAASAFIHVYEGSTTADPIMPNATWRVVGDPGAVDEPDVLVETDRVGPRNQLRDAAAEICASYVALVGVSTARLGPG